MGDLLGKELGIKDGTTDGALLGSIVGDLLGKELGIKDGTTDGALLG